MKRSHKLEIKVFAGTLCVLISFFTQGQVFKKKPIQKEVPRTEYAYQTISTLKKKEKKKGFGGDGAQFHFEKPRKKTSITRYDPQMVKAENFGHRHLIRRPIGNAKLCRVCGIKH